MHMPLEIKFLEDYLFSSNHCCGKHSILYREVPCNDKYNEQTYYPYRERDNSTSSLSFTKESLRRLYLRKIIQVTIPDTFVVVHAIEVSEKLLEEGQQFEASLTSLKYNSLTDFVWYVNITEDTVTKSKDIVEIDYNYLQTLLYHKKIIGW